MESMGINKEKYTTVHVPTVLARMVDEIIENEEGAYSSRSEFIKDAVRRFLEYYGYYPRNRNRKTHELSADCLKTNSYVDNQTVSDPAK
jgi:Arc/MetJ-type ribon-helix-helix transcriptional regulator